MSCIVPNVPFTIPASIQIFAINITHDFLDSNNSDSSFQYHINWFFILQLPVCTIWIFVMGQFKNLSILMLTQSTSFHVISIEMVFENCLHSVLLRFSSNLMLSFFQLVSLLSPSHIYKSMFLNSRYSFSPDCLSMTSTLYISLNSLYTAILSFDLVLAYIGKLKNRWNLSKISKQYYESIPESFIFFW